MMLKTTMKNPHELESIFMLLHQEVSSEVGASSLSLSIFVLTLNQVWYFMLFHQVPSKAGASSLHQVWVEIGLKNKKTTYGKVSKAVFLFFFCLFVLTLNQVWYFMLLHQVPSEVGASSLHQVWVEIGLRKKKTTHGKVSTKF